MAQDTTNTTVEEINHVGDDAVEHYEAVLNDDTTYQFSVSPDLEGGLAQDQGKHLEDHGVDVSDAPDHVVDAVASQLADYHHYVHDPDALTAVVDPDDVLTMMERNVRDRNESRTHVLRVTPPLEGEREASLHVSEDNAHYPPEMTPKPLHVSATALLTGHTDKPLPTEYRYPDHNEVRHRYERDHGDDDVYWDEYWETELEVWRSNVRDGLVESVTFDVPGGEDYRVNVRYEQ